MTAIMAELEVGDVIELRHGPFASDWRVVSIGERGAVLEIETPPVFVGFSRLLHAPFDSVPLTSTTSQEFLVKTHFRGAKMGVPIPGRSSAES
jgi:hypothetical protein